MCTIQLLYSIVNLSHKFYFVDTSDDRKMRKRSIKLKSKAQEEKNTATATTTRATTKLDRKLKIRSLD